MRVYGNTAKWFSGRLSSGGEPTAVNAIYSGAIRGRWLTGTGIALLTALSVMPMLYYFYTEAFGVELLWADILILFLSVLTGQLAGLHFYDHSSGDCGKAAVLFIMITVLLFVFFTFRPPHLPWFQDGSTGVFGIGLQ